MGHPVVVYVKNATNKKNPSTQQFINFLSVTFFKKYVRYDFPLSDLNVSPTNVCAHAKRNNRSHASIKLLDVTAIGFFLRNMLRTRA